MKDVSCVRDPMVTGSAVSELVVRLRKLSAVSCPIAVGSDVSELLCRSSDVSTLSARMLVGKIDRPHDPMFRLVMRATLPVQSHVDHGQLHGDETLPHPMHATLSSTVPLVWSDARRVTPDKHVPVHSIIVLLQVVHSPVDVLHVVHAEQAAGCRVP